MKKLTKRKKRKIVGGLLVLGAGLTSAFLGLEISPEQTGTLLELILQFL